MAKARDLMYWQEWVFGAFAAVIIMVVETIAAKRRHKK